MYFSSDSNSVPQTTKCTFKKYYNNVGCKRLAQEQVAHFIKKKTNVIKPCAHKFYFTVLFCFLSFVLTCTNVLEKEFKIHLRLTGSSEVGAHEEHVNAAWLDDGAERKEKRRSGDRSARFLAPIRFKEKKTASFSLTFSSDSGPAAGSVTAVSRCCSLLASLAHYLSLSY